MTDIATRLRQSYHLDTVQPDHILRVAVDEIERLQHDVERHIGIAATYAESIVRLTAERDEARSLLREARSSLQQWVDTYDHMPDDDAELFVIIYALLAKEGA